MDRVHSGHNITAANVVGGIVTAVAILAAAVSVVALVVLLAPASIPCLGFLGGVALIVTSSAGGGALVMAAGAIFSFTLAGRWKQENKDAKTFTHDVTPVPTDSFPKTPAAPHTGTPKISSDQPKCVSDKDWAVLEPLLKDVKPGETKKFSRRQYNTTYSYVRMRDGEVYRCSHKKYNKNKKTGKSKIHDPIGNGSFKVATGLYSSDKKATFVRCSEKAPDNVMKLRARNERTARNKRAFELFGHLPNFMAPEPHIYTNPAGETKIAYYTPMSRTLWNQMNSRYEFKLEEKKDILLQIANAIKIIHASGYAHRDIKPENIYIEKINGKWQVKIADFDTLLEKVDGNDILVQGTPNYLPHEFDPTRFGSFQYTFEDAKYTDLYALTIIGDEIFGRDTLQIDDNTTIDDLIDQIKKLK